MENLNPITPAQPGQPPQTEAKASAPCDNCGSNLPQQQGQNPEPKKSRRAIIIAAGILVAGLVFYFLGGSTLFKGFIGLKPEELAGLEECVKGIPADGLKEETVYPLEIKEGCEVQIATTDENKAKIAYSQMPVGPNAFVNPDPGGQDATPEAGPDATPGDTPEATPKITFLSSFWADVFHADTAGLAELINPITAHFGDTVAIVTYSVEETAQNIVQIRFNNKQWDLDVQAKEEKAAVEEGEEDPVQKLKKMAETVADGGSILEYLLIDESFSNYAAKFHSIEGFAKNSEAVLNKLKQFLVDNKDVITSHEFDQVQGLLGLKSDIKGDKSPYTPEKIDSMIASLDTGLSQISDAKEIYSIEKFAEEVNENFLSGVLGFKKDSLQNEECKNLQVLKTGELNEKGEVTLTLYRPSVCVVGDDIAPKTIQMKNINGKYFPTYFTVGDKMSELDVLADAADIFNPEAIGKITGVIDTFEKHFKKFRESEDKNPCKFAGETMGLVRKTIEDIFEGEEMPPYFFESFTTQVNTPVEIPKSFLENPIIDSGEIKYNPLFGVATDGHNTVTYTPNDGYEGYDGFVYKIALKQDAPIYYLGKNKMIEGMVDSILKLKGTEVNPAAEKDPKGIKFPGGGHVTNALYCVAVGKAPAKEETPGEKEEPPVGDEKTPDEGEKVEGEGETPVADDLGGDVDDFGGEVDDLGGDVADIVGDVDSEGSDIVADGDVSGDIGSVENGGGGGGGGGFVSTTKIARDDSAPEIKTGKVTIDDVLNKFTCLEKTENPSKFTDTDDETVNLLASLGFKGTPIIQGFADIGKPIFDGSALTNRAEILKTLMVSSCTPFDLSLTDSDLFKDIQSTAWYTPYVGSARKQDIVEGYESGKYYRPAQMVTRMEAIKMMARISGIDKAEDSCEKKPFSDVNKNHWGYEISRDAYCSNVIAGKMIGEKRYLLPDAPMTRDEMAVFLYNFYVAKVGKAL